MEERRIVKSGNSSFIVSLPIAWIHKNKLDKGSSVLVEENEVGDLVIAKREHVNSSNTSTKTLNVDGKSADKITYEIFQNYTQSYQNIILEGNSIPIHLAKIKEVIHNCIGLEIIEQSKKNIIVKNFTTNDDGLSPRILIRKMTLGIGEMFNLIGKFTKEGLSQNEINELQELVEQNNRIYLLARKTILRAIEHPEYIRTFQTTYHQLTKDKVIAASFYQMMFSLHSLGNVMLFIEHTKEDAVHFKEMLDSLKSDYESLLSNLRYKDAASLSDLYERCLKNTIKIKYLARETKNYFIIESSIYLSILVEFIKQISLELTE